MRARLLGLAVCAAAYVGFSAVAPNEVKWVARDGVGTSVTDMADWFDADNWGVGGPVNSTADWANFADVTGVRFIRLTDDAMTGGFRGLSSTSLGEGLAAANRVIVTGDGYRLSNEGSTTSTHYETSGIDLYADLGLGENAYVVDCNVAGDIVNAQKMIIAWGTFYHHMDWYAKEAGGARTNAQVFTHLYQGSGWLRFIAPESSATDVTGRWSGTAGQPYLTRTGADHVLPVGTLVHGAGIPEGTYLKRVYTRSLVELSQPLSDDLTDGEVTFDAQTARVYKKLSTYELATSAMCELEISKYREEDDHRWEVDYFAVPQDGRAYWLSTRVGRYPGTLVVHDATLVRRYAFGSSHVEFAAAGAGKQNGFPNAIAFYSGSSKSSTSRFTAPSGLSASILCYSNLQNRVVKDGAGTLRVGLEQTKVANTGTLVAEEGLLEISSRTPDVVTTAAGTLAVSNGATLKVAAGSRFAATQLVAQPGATIVLEKGAQIVVSGGGRFIDGATVTGEGAIVESGFSGLGGDPVFAMPAPQVVGVPAFWVDAASLTNETPCGVVEEEGGVKYVSRWNDCRGTDGCRFCTNQVLRPTLETGAKGPYVKIAASSSKANVRGLVWDRRITGIKAAFYVLDPTDGGGVFLGDSKPTGGMGDFMRGGIGKSNSLIYTGAKCASAIHYLNGIEKKSSETLANETDPTIWEVHTVNADGGGADAFSLIGGREHDLSGNGRIHEFIIYTNALTYAERLQVASYLSQKWRGTADLPYEFLDRRQREDEYVVSDHSGGVVAAEGETVGFAGLSGEGRFLKAGQGQVWIFDAVSPSTDIAVAEGVLGVRSYSLTESPVRDAYLHLDASQTNTFKWTHNAAEGLDRISEWKDLTSGIKATPYFANCTNQPTLRLNALNGLAMADFGPGLGSRNSYTMDLSCLTFAGSKKIQTIFTVLDTAGGGSVLLGGSAGRNDTGDGYHGVWRDVQSWPTWYAQPLVIGTSNRTIDGKAVNSSSRSGDYAKPNITEVRLNGAVVDQQNTGFTGGFDLVSVRSSVKMRGNLIGGIHYGYSAGGAAYGEIIYYERYLGGDELKSVECYLNKKWFNRATPSYREASLGTATVASGATLKVAGGAPLALTGLAGSGAVDGSVTLAEDGTVGVEVGPDGAVAPLTISGALALPQAGVVLLSGDVRRLAAGDHAILCAADGLADGALDGWTVEGGAAHRSYALSVRNGAVVLNVAKDGLLLLVK